MKFLHKNLAHKFFAKFEAARQFCAKTNQGLAQKLLDDKFFAKSKAITKFYVKTNQVIAKKPSW